MNPAAQIMRLCQEDLPIEDCVQDFIELAYLTTLDTVCLMIFFLERGYLSHSV